MSVFPAGVHGILCQREDQRGDGQDAGGVQHGEHPLPPADYQEVQARVGRGQ